MRRGCLDGVGTGNGNREAAILESIIVYYLGEMIFECLSSIHQKLDGLEGRYEEGIVGMLVDRDCVAGLDLFDSFYDEWYWGDVLTNF